MLAVFGLLSVVIVLVLVFRNNKSDQVLINKDQIRMEKNGEIITVNENGLVEYRTEDTVTYKIWDSSKVSRFFDTVRNKARDYLENPRIDAIDCVYVSLYLDGEFVTICFSEDDDVVQEAYEDFEGGDSDSITLSDLFDDDDEDSEDEVVDDISDYFSVTPTPTRGPTPTPGGSTSEPQLPPPLPIKATCESWEEQIVGGRAIISNTLCSVAPKD